MIYVDRKSFSIPQVFVSKEIQLAQKRLGEFYNRSKSSRSQEKYSKPFEPELRDQFLNALRELFNGKCAYCESPVINSTKNSEYDHFRPKSGSRGLNNEFSNDHYWWLTYEWNNLYYSCHVCNRFKSTWFPVQGNRAKLLTPYSKIIQVEKNLLIDPCVDQPQEHLSYNEKGEVIPLTSKGETTVEILKLNRSELVGKRSDLIKTLKEKYDLFLRLLPVRSLNAKMFRQTSAELLAIFDERSTSPFLGIQRHMVYKWSEKSQNVIEFLRGQNFTTQLYQIDHTEENKPKSDQTVKEKRKIKATEKFQTLINSDSIRHIYIEKIEIENFKCFSFLEIKFDKQDITLAGIKGEQKIHSEPWLLFLGENGVGKSSLLKALAIGLAGQEYINHLKVSGKDFLKHGAKKGSIKIHLVGAVRPIEVTFDNSEIKSSLFQPIVNLVAYNSIRLIPRKEKFGPEKGVFYGIRAKNLFDYTASLIDVDNWLLTREKEVFDRVAITLKDLMMLDSKDKIERTNDKIFIRRGKDLFTVDELSDGYQSVYALAIDIMATLAKDNATFDLVEGVVLIDEIGTHLHPRWRMEVVGQLRKAFPKIQFVVTTHEPLCLRGLVNGETVVLTKNSNKNIIALTELPDPSELRVDQILTSDFFGLKSALDPSTEKLFEEYYSILELDESERTDAQKNRLLELSELIPKIKHLGNSIREDMIYYVVDELLAKRTRDAGFKIKEELQEEAVKRVENIWKLIDTDKKL